MKKFFLLVAAACVAFAANAHTLNNPVGTDGRYIVKYDCAKGAFAESNDIEIDETFTFAIDVTGTWLADWLKETPAAEGASRGVAFNCWTNWGDTNSDFRRLKQIDGNIWGYTCNYAQLMKGIATDFENALMADSITYVSAQVFGFEYTDANPGAGWWMWADGVVVGENTQAEGSDCCFAFLPYTGTKTSEEFFGDEVGTGIYGFSFAGYASPCALETADAVENTAVKAATIKLIEDGQLYLIKDGVRYNVLGAAVK